MDNRQPVRHQPSMRVAPMSNQQLNYQQIKARQELAHVNVVVTKPGNNVWDFEHPWSYTLFACCDDARQCCLAFCCLCYFECKLHRRAGDSMWTCVCPCSRYALRSKIRTAFRIEGDLCDDCFVTTCCPCCASIQISRELHYQGL